MANQSKKVRSGSLRRALRQVALPLGLWGGTALWAGPQLGIGGGDGTADTPGAGIVPVTFASDSPAVAVQFDVLFDTTRLISAPAMRSDSLPNHQVVSSEPVPGTRRVVVYSPNNVALPNGLLVNLQFTPRAQSADGMVTLTPANVLVANASAQSVTPVTLEPGSFTVGARARFNSVSVSAAGVVELQLSGPPGRTYALQISADLRQWTSLKTNAIPAEGVLKLEDSTATAANARFYRALQK